MEHGSTTGSRTIFATVWYTLSATVEMSKGRVPPLSLLTSTRRTGGGKYQPDDMRFT